MGPMLVFQISTFFIIYIFLQGPISKIDLSNLSDRDSDEDYMLENEFPYISGRLTPIAWEKIVRKGTPWTDPHFPPGKASLFMNK